MANTARPEDRPLHDDVRFLGTCLGDAIRRFEGEPLFEAVESLRTATRARRRDADDARTLDDLFQRVDAFDLDIAQGVARAFTLFFLLINTAEQVHRVRRRMTYRNQSDSAPQPASARWALNKLKADGLSGEKVRQHLEQLHIRPVLTAHPTEATRMTVLSLQSRIADGLLDRSGTADVDGALVEEQIEGDVELLWLTSEVRQDRLSVHDEIATTIWYLEDRLLEADAQVRAAFERSFRGAFDEPLALDLPLSLGNWVGGDRDGNPFVTPQTTLTAAHAASQAILRYYRKKIDSLTERLAISASLAEPPAALRQSIEADRAVLPMVWDANQRRDADEPLRLKLSLIQARLEATQAYMAQDQGIRPAAAYADAQAFVRDLELVESTVLYAGAEKAAEALVHPLLAQARCHGFYGYRLDVREDASVHTATIEALKETIGVPDLNTKTKILEELLGRRPLLGRDLPLDDATKKSVEVFSTMRKLRDQIGEGAASTYIVSMTKNETDLLRVLLLAREAGLVDLAGDSPRSSIDVVPLFETRADLEASSEIMQRLFATDVWQRQLKARGGRQEVMLGYSDSAKDAGVLPAAWSLYQAQERLADIADTTGVEIQLFHGRGGTVGRGGGSPVYRGLFALPAGSLKSGIKITEQGEVISQKFGLLSIAERSLEVMLTGTLLGALSDWRDRISEEDVRAFRSTMDEMAATALPVFRELVYEDNALFQLFSTATPVKELAHVHYGSRPAYRERGAGTMKGIRAIPWVFGWTQIRLMLPGWLGVGSAIEKITAREGGLALLQRMTKSWPYFDDLLGKVEMVCAKADLAIAGKYVEELGGDAALFDKLTAEFDRTVQGLLAIRQQDRLLDDSEVLRSAIDLRNPYVDPLSLLEISLLKKKRAGQSSEALDRALGTTLNGIAQGLRNTG